MSQITIINSGQVINGNMARSLLVLLQINEIPIQTLCGGKAFCGKCLLKVVSGKKYLSPVRESERVRLKALDAGEDMRLACQTYAGRDIEIEIINFGNPAPSAD